MGTPINPVYCLRCRQPSEVTDADGYCSPCAEIGRLERKLRAAEQRAQDSGRAATNEGSHRPAAQARSVASPGPIAWAARELEELLSGVSSGPSIICPNTNCAYRGPARQTARGNCLLATVLLLLCFLPGVFYLIFMQGYRYNCPQCGLQISVDN